ncbi:hypothetical protein M3J09_008868 [Ascochyta lentis]
MCDSDPRYQTLLMVHLHAYLLTVFLNASPEILIGLEAHLAVSLADIGAAS